MLWKISAAEPFGRAGVKPNMSEEGIESFQMQGAAESRIKKRTGLAQLVKRSPNLCQRLTDTLETLETPSSVSPGASTPSGA